MPSSKTCKLRTLFSSFLILFLVPPSSHAEQTLSLARELSYAVKKTPSAVMMFHYVKKSKLGFADGSMLNRNASEVRNHVKNWSQYYWDMTQPEDGRDVRGLYLAIDPIVSRTFGGTDDNWVLYQIKIPAGTPYLDLKVFYDEHGSSQIMTGAQQQQLLDAGCNSVNTYDHLFRKSNSHACRAIAFKTLSDLKVDMLRYDWSSVRLKGCGERESAAYINLHSEKISTTDVKIWTADLDSDPIHVKQAAILEAVWNRTLPKQDNLAVTETPEIFKHLNPWPTLETESEVLEESGAVDVWMKKNLSGCQ